MLDDYNLIPLDTFQVDGSTELQIYFCSRRKQLNEVNSRPTARRIRSLYNSSGNLHNLLGSVLSMSHRQRHLAKLIRGLIYSIYN